MGSLVTKFILVSFLTMSCKDDQSAANKLKCQVGHEMLLWQQLVHMNYAVRLIWIYTVSNMMEGSSQRKPRPPLRFVEMASFAEASDCIQQLNGHVFPKCNARLGVSFKRSDAEKARLAQTKEVGSLCLFFYLPDDNDLSKRNNLIT